MLVRKSKTQRFFKWLFSNPARGIMSSFLFVVIVGTILLWLPQSSATGESQGLLVALFTTVSATCVTGLVLVDTGTSFSTFGHVVIMSLIQVGGLGLITITLFFLELVRRKVGLRTKVLGQEAAGSFNFVDLSKLIKFIILFTLSLELVAAGVFATQFVPLFGWKKGIGKSIFHSISAFCNAGFDLFGETKNGPFSSLTTFQDNPLVLLLTAFLIISGGVGFVVWRDIFDFPKTKKLKLHSKIVLLSTVSLLMIGFVFILLVEWDNKNIGAIGTLPKWERPIAAFFQSVTMRTAGFNSVNLSTLTAETKLVSVILMFIGAAPGSTGGGIKVTTFVLFFYFVLSNIKGEDEVVIKKHSMPIQAVKRAISTSFIALFLIVMLSMLLSITESKALEAKDFQYLDLLFESVSAFGTVGVSSASTPHLSTLGQFLIIPVMFIGRVGPVTFAMSLALRDSKRKISSIYPEGKILIG